MITTRDPPRTQRLLIGAFVLSVAVHLCGGALWARGDHLVARIMQRLPEQHQHEAEIATSDVVHLERRTIPRPANAHRARPVPRVRHPQALAAQMPAVAPPEAARLRPMPARSAPPEIAHLTRHAPPRVVRSAKAATSALATASPTQPKRAALSPQQIARLDARFARTIQASHVDLATIQKQAEQRPVATRPMPMQFAGIQATLERGEGYITPTTSGQRVGGTVWYYTHYTYMWPDGHLEDDDIPWPFHYPVQRDLFALHIHLIPLQLPPPGFRLTRPLKPFLAHFVQAGGRG
jgi:hypothetical protein